MAEAPTKRQTQPSATKRHVLERHAPEVVAIFAMGERPVDVARMYGVDRSTATRFEQSHADDIAALRVEVIRQVEDYAIAQKVTRIADLDMLRRLALDEIAANGYAWTEETKYGTKRKVSGAVQELRDADRQAADELGQIPRADVNVQQNIVLIKQVLGVDDAIPLG